MQVKFRFLNLLSGGKSLKALMSLCGAGSIYFVTNVERGEELLYETLLTFEYFWQNNYNSQFLNISVMIPIIKVVTGDRQVQIDRWAIQNFT